MPCLGCPSHCIPLAHGEQVGINARIYRSHDLHPISAIAEDDHHVVARWEFLYEFKRWREVCVVVSDTCHAIAQNVEPELVIDGNDGVAALDHQKVAKLGCVKGISTEVIDPLLYQFPDGDAADLLGGLKITNDLHMAFRLLAFDVFLANTDCGAGRCLLEDQRL